MMFVLQSKKHLKGAIVIILEDVTIIVPIVHCHIKVCNMKVHSGYFEEKKVQKNPGLILIIIFLYNTDMKK